MPSVEYCRVEPTGQDVAGASITPPLRLHDVQVLSVGTTAAGAAAVSMGQTGVHVMVVLAVFVQPLPDSVTITV